KMTKERSGSSSNRRPIETSLSNSYSSGVSSLSSSNYGVKTIRVFKNGDPYHPGTKFVVNRRYVCDMEHLLNILSEKIDLPYGAKRLFTTNGKLIRHLNDLEDKQDYVASSNHFIPLKYGNTTTTFINQFRSSSPINTSTPQSRQSRSQTRNEVKPAVKKRSQSGLTSASTTSERNGKTKAKEAEGTSPKKTADGKPKKKVVKKKKKIESEVIIPVADEKKEETKEEVKEVKKEEKEEKKEEEKKEEKKEEKQEPKKEEQEEIVIPEAKEDTPQTIEGTPPPKQDDQAEKPNPSEDEPKEEKSRSPSPSGHSAHTATEDEDHSGSENESDAEKPPARKPTPKPNGKEQPKSGKSSGESGSEKEGDN
ncbi:hypothetical protein V3C99_013220, partial [Haemonchus contortus]